MLASMCPKLSSDRCGCRLICVTLVLLSLSCLRSQRSPVQVDAIISPKARVCFNSMASTFQSECVYCDARLYTSTMTACTGQPTLANNVTQAQAFCIATACLEVPVLNKAAEPLKAANDFLTNYMNKLNLYRPSLLFGARDGGADWFGLSDLGHKHHKMMFGSSSKAHAYNSNNDLLTSNKKLMFPNTLHYLRQEVIDKVTDYMPQIKPNDANLDQSNGDTQMTTTKSPETKVDVTAGVTTAAVATASGATDTQIGSQVPAIDDEVKSTAPVDYPDFNKMHAKIYSNWIEMNNNNRNKLIWRRQPNYSQLMNNHQYQMPHQQQQQRQHMIMNQMSNLMQTFYSKLAEKRANWQTGRIPVVLGRKKRSLLPSFSLNLNKNKQKLQNNGTVTAQLNKLVNGTTSGNLAFVLNKPSAAYIWSNPLTKVFTKNSPNKSLTWQFGKGQTVAAAAAAPAAAGQMANPQQALPRPAALLAGTTTSGLSSQTTSTSTSTGRPMSLALNSNPPPRASLSPQQGAAAVQQQQQSAAAAGLIGSSQTPTDTIESSAALSNGASFVVAADEVGATSTQVAARG